MKSLLPADIYGDIPLEFRTVEAPKEPKVEVQYYEAWIQHMENTANLTWNQKQRIIRAFQKKLEAARNAHECACCGIILRIPAPIGPECAKHPQKFPCNAFRRKQA